MNPNILLVDDDKKLLSVLKTIFTEEDYAVTACSDGLEAINICREQKFDLIITDLMMPGANGLEVLKETRKIDPDILVILITGFASLETAIQAIREGAYDYITKPFRLEEIKILVNNAREKIRLISENKRLFHELQEAYKQLHMMKTIIGADNSEGERSTVEDESRDPFIAGSMLPLYYTENRAIISSPILSGLERISTLKEKGLLTEEEFNLCKSRLFKNI
ncbi:MAG: sigma-54-dependent Fis family transcriptional regulator [Deltaproteobacteria bacterium]|nr:sigma-54-dependent Fis family transcriptional regulator [Deltaproteobacteria bacterium]